MLRKYWRLSLFTGVVMAVAAMSVATTWRNVTAKSSVDAPLGLYSYAVKFVCGYQPLPHTPSFSEPVVKPGNYATDINIHNPQNQIQELKKKLIVMVQPGKPITNAREPSAVNPITIAPMKLNVDQATMDDCTNLWKLGSVTGLPSPPANSLTIGYLVIQSQLELDVDVVYTAEVNAKPDSGPQASDVAGISIDVERVVGKKV